jgi:hypothetical protein
MHSVSNNRKVMAEAEAATYIRMRRSFLRQSRMDGVRTRHTPGLKFLKIGRSVRYLISDLDQWLEQFRLADRA